MACVKSGGSDPSGFDCSGLVQYVFARQGIALPRDVRRQFQVGYEIPAADLRPGDLLFFDTEADGASHVAIALDGGRSSMLRTRGAWSA